MKGTSLTILIGAILCAGSLAAPQDFAPTPTPGTVCATLSFSSESLSSLSPAFVTVAHRIYIRNGDDTERDIGTYLASNFSIPFCYVSRIRGDRKSVICPTSKRLVVQRKSRGETLKFKGPRESFMLIVAGPNFGPGSSTFADGQAYYLTGGKIFDIALPKGRKTPRIELGQVGTYQGTCDSRVS